MYIQVKVVPNAKQEKIIESEEGFKAYLTVPAKEGKANEALIKLLARHFQVKKSQIKIKVGVTARTKIVEIK